MQGLTSRQSDVLAMFHHHATTPTYREIAAQCAIPVSTAHRIVGALEARGLVVRDRGKARSARLVRDTRLLNVPTLSLLREVERRGFKIDVPKVIP